MPEEKCWPALPWTEQVAINVKISYDDIQPQYVMSAKNKHQTVLTRPSGTYKNIDPTQTDQTRKSTRTADNSKIEYS